MLGVVIFVCLTVPWIEAQRQRGGRPFDNGHGWDIRLAVPGEPGNDYPTLSTIPKTSFTCSNKEPGYYADVETNCQVFRICTLGSTFGFQSFLCPNGTLFNQAVFVCDWWMNVNCKKSTEYYNTNDKHSNLKVGTKLMSDVKKMITHPMRNPYDRTIIRNNLMVMQEYKQPVKLYIPNDDRFDQNERNIDNFYVYPKQAQNIIREEIWNDRDIYTASTANPSYVPKSQNFQQSVQKQFQNHQTHNNIIAHPKLTQEYSTPNRFSNQFNPNLQISRVQEQEISHQPQNSNKLSRNSFDTIQSVETQPLEQQHNKVNNIAKQENNNKKYASETTDLNRDFYNSASSRPNTLLSQKLVSNSISPTLITKTLTYRKVIENPKKGQPKSRITFKTWIVKPTRNARLVSEPTPYTYSRPTVYQLDNLVTGPSYVYDQPENPLPLPKLTYDSFATDVVPTVQSSSIITTLSERDNPIYVPKPTTSNRLYLAPLNSVPTKSSVIYLPPTTYKPVSLLYIPPAINSQLKLDKSGSSTDDENPSYTITKQAHINTNNKNLSFSDILTKEKLDITVNDIVKGTHEIIKTKSKNIYNQNIQINNEFPDSNYLPPDSSKETDETTSHLQPVLPKSSRLIAIPSIQLEPPNEHTKHYNNESNKTTISKESTLPKNTIERTVSLRITIPENIADLIFKSDDASNDLEILNTGSSNYLILNDKKNDNYIPLGKLKWNKSPNFSDSQDLVQSVLSDSINAAKQYSDFVKQQPTLATEPTQPQDFNKLEVLTDKETLSHPSKNLITTQNYKSNQKQQEQFTQTKITKQDQIQSLRPQSEKIQINSKNIYSGQLYKLPVPLVTKQIYNAPWEVSTPKSHSSNNLLHERRQNAASNVEDINKSKLQQNEKYEQLTTLSNRSQNTHKSSSTTTELKEHNTEDDEINFESEFINNIKDTDNRISAHIHDKTVGTINHPYEDKLISYKKDKSYVVYTQLNNNLQSNVIPFKESEKNNDNTHINRIPSVGKNLSKLVALQYIPSEHYSGVKTHLNNIQTEQNIQEPLANYNRRLDVSSNIDYTVDHPLSNIRADKNNILNKLYEGPSSYSAPQLLIGNLERSQPTKSDYNSRLENFENNDSSFKGYLKETPSKRFTF